VNLFHCMYIASSDLFICITSPRNCFHRLECDIVCLLFVLISREHSCVERLYSFTVPVCSFATKDPIGSIPLL